MTAPNDAPGRTATSVVLAVVLVVGLTVAPVGTAVAQSSGDDPIDDWLETVDESQDDESDGFFGRIKQAAPQGAVNGLAILDGQLDRTISNPFASQPTNQETANEFESVVESNNDTYEREINAEANVTTEYDTHSIIIAHEDSDPVSVFLLGDVSNGNVSNMRVLSQSEFNDTDRVVDEIWVADGDAAADLPRLADTIAERIVNDEQLGETYQRRLAGRYCSATALGAPWKASANLEACDVRSTMWMDKQTVLEGA